MFPLKNNLGKCKSNKVLLNISMIAFVSLYTGDFNKSFAQVGNQIQKKLPKQYQQQALSFEHTIKLAQQYDPWLVGNKHRQQGISSLSQAAATLPDPKLSMTLANLPTNGFDFGQEAMSQFKVGITQVFPRGDSLAVKNRQLRQQSEVYPFQRQDRKAQIAVTVGGLWLDLYKVQQSLLLIEKNRGLFEQLSDVAQVNYSSALSSAAGKTRQQDIIRAQLELTRLEDRIDHLEQQKNSYQGQIALWLSQFNVVNSLRGANSINDQPMSLHDLKISTQLPNIPLLQPHLVKGEQWLKEEVIVTYLSNHPAVVSLDKKISSVKTGIKLAEQAYQPEWAVNASYGYRDDDPMGNSRADLFSVGITFDLPLFTENRQNMAVKSAISKTEVSKTDKVLLLRKLLSAYSSNKGRLFRVIARKERYQATLLPQIHDQAEAALSAYTHDEADFSEVVRARIEVLNAEIDELSLCIEERKIGLALNYIFIGTLAKNGA
jgi:outer membrane protein TolC